MAHATDKKIEHYKKVDDFTDLGQFKQWQAFAMFTKDENICWISSKPFVFNKKEEKDTEKNSLIMLSIRLEKEDRNEFSYHSIHNLATQQKLDMRIDNQIRFSPVPENKWAWLRSSIDEGRFVIAAQKGHWLNISGKTSRDKDFKERYSLAGFTKAYQTAFEECSKKFTELQSQASTLTKTKVSSN